MSDLTVLIERAKRCKHAGCSEQDDCGAGEFLEMCFAERLVNIAEYLTYSHDYTPEESTDAIVYLWEHGMNKLIGEPKAITEFLNKLYSPRIRHEPMTDKNPAMDVLA
jgi:hypothetical protein